MSEGSGTVTGMSQVIFYTASTLNGFLADEDDSLDWLFAVPGGETAESGDTGFTAFFESIGALVLGSATYEWVLRHEGFLDHPDTWHKFYGDRPTFVFTSRELPIPSGVDVRLVSGDVTTVWPGILAAAAGRDIWLVGGGDVAGQFADAGLLSELRISIAPATLAAGKPLLPRVIGSDRLHLEEVSRTGQFAQLVFSVGHS